MGKILDLYLTPTLRFILGALPRNTAALKDTLAKAKAKDETIAVASADAAYAGDADLYRRDDKEGEVDTKGWA